MCHPIYLQEAISLLAVKERNYGVFLRSDLQCGEVCNDLRLSLKSDA